MGTMDETMAEMDEWEMRKAIRMSLGEDSDEEEDLAIRTSRTPNLSYTSGFGDNKKAIVATGKLWNCSNRVELG